MHIQRKIQLGALAVLANSLLALGLTASYPAHASSCGAKTFCPCQTLAFCQSQADPGCTATSVICGLGTCPGNVPPAHCLYKVS